MRFTFVSEHLKRIKSEGKSLCIPEICQMANVRPRADGGIASVVELRGGWGGRLGPEGVCVLCVTSAAYFLRSTLTSV